MCCNCACCIVLDVQEWEDVARKYVDNADSPWIKPHYVNSLIGSVLLFAFVESVMSRLLFYISMFTKFLFESFMYDTHHWLSVIQ